MAKRVITRFRDNYQGFWKAYRWFLTVFVVAILCDAASTIYFMTSSGPDFEEHPAIRIVSMLFGPFVGPLIGAIAKILTGILVAIYCRRWAVHILLTVSILSFWAAWYNVWGQEMYVPRLIKWLSFL